MTRRYDFSGNSRFNDTLDVRDVGHHEAAFRRPESIAELFNGKSGFISTDQVPECHVTRALRDMFGKFTKLVRAIQIIRDTFF
jgi:hypothetical protein